MQLDSIKRLYTLFTSRKWSDNDGHDIVFENFCDLLSNLDTDEQQLIFELTERYNWITFSEYNSLLIKILENIPEEELMGVKTIILFPIMKPEDQKKTKSGHAVLYLFRALKPLIKNFGGIEFKEIESYDTILKNDFKIKDNERLYLIDDFLGSGETIDATISEILKNKNINIEKISVVAIASLTESVSYLSDKSIKFYINLIIDKGISEYYKTPELEEKIEIMKRIEKLIPGNNFSFGYNESEALITLMRTPDNTFPIFWMEYKKNSKKFKAPFSRF